MIWRPNRLRTWRYDYWRPERRRRRNCRRRAERARARGLLVPKSCEAPCCTMIDVEMHHDDYDKPLQVRWLCKHHHLLKTRLDKLGVTPENYLNV